MNANVKNAILTSIPAFEFPNPLQKVSKNFPRYTDVSPLLPRWDPPPNRGHLALISIRSSHAEHPAIGPMSTVHSNHQNSPESRNSQSINICIHNSAEQTIRRMTRNKCINTARIAGVWNARRQIALTLLKCRRMLGDHTHPASDNRLPNGCANF